MFNIKLLAEDVYKNRKETKISQTELAESTGINRVLIGKLEKGEFTPSIEQFEKLCSVLGLNPADYFKTQKPRFKDYSKPMNIAVAGTGYVGLSLAVLLAQHNHVVAVDVIEDKVNKINNRISPIQDDYIEKYLAEKDLDLVATLDGAKAYKDAEMVIIAAPTNYDSKLNFFDTKYVEQVIELVLSVNPNAIMIIKSTIPVGYTESVRKKYNTKNIIFSPEFLRESKALYDNLYPSRIIVGCPKDDSRVLEYANKFANLLQEGAIKEDITTLIMEPTEAEAVKLFANTYLALRVAYFN